MTAPYPNLAEASANLNSYNARIDRALETGYLAGLTAADPAECAGCWHLATPAVAYDDEVYCQKCEATLHAIVYHPTNKETTTP